MLRQLIVIFLISFNVTSFAQRAKDIIVQNFSRIEYYEGKDSTIKCAYLFDSPILNTIAIEFDRNGEPSAAGWYCLGQKEGYWMTANDGYTLYEQCKEPKHHITIGCGTGTHLALRIFYEQYIRSCGYVN